MKKLVSLITALVLLASLCVFSASAATAKAAVSASSSTVKPNDQFTVTLRVSADTGMGSVQGQLSYNASLVEFVSGESVNGAGGLLTLSKWDSTGNGASEFKFVITFKAKAEGSNTFTFTSTEISDVNYNYLSNVSASSSVSIQAEKPLSSNNYLKSLTLSSGTLSPAFSKSVLNYTVNVPNETTTMYLTPTVEDSTATTSVSGSATLKVGSNTRKVTVTAQNGSKRTYTIKIVRASNGSEVPPSDTPSSQEPDAPVVDEQIFIDGNPFTVVDELPADKIPAGFSATVTKLGDKEVMAVVNGAGSVTMLYLEDENGEAKFYVYNKADISYHLYQPLTVLNQNFIVIEKPKSVNLPKGFSPRALELGENQYDAWIYDANQDFYLVYLCNQNGELGFYLYDCAEGTLQRYIGTLPNSNIAKPDSNTNAPVVEINDSFFGKFGLIVIIPLGAAVIALTVLLIVFLSKKEKADLPKVERTDKELNFDDNFILNDNNEE